MKAMLVAALGLVCATAFAQDGGITVWPKGVPPAGTTHVDFGDHNMAIAHREVNGRVEVHQNKADVIVVQTGSATLVTGGEVEGCAGKRRTWRPLLTTNVSW